MRGHRGGDGLRGGRRDGLETLEAARETAVDGLMFLAADPQRIGAFMAATGTSLSELRASAASLDTLRAVLDHLMGDESLLLVFAANTGRRPEQIGQALAILERADEK